MKYQRFLAVTLSTAFLAACGGGSGDAAGPLDPVASTLSFPYGSADKSANSVSATVILTANGTLATESRDGLCSGSRTFYRGTPVGGVTFETSPALSVVGTTATSWSNCTPPESVSTSTSYYDTNYVYLGSINESGGYSIRQAGYITPSSVKVGDAVIRGTESAFSNSTKTLDNGHRDDSLIVEADTADTAIVNTISKYYNPYVLNDLWKDGRLRMMTQYRSRITSTGNLTLISLDIQTYNTGFRLVTDPSNAHHYVFRR